MPFPPQYYYHLKMKHLSITLIMLCICAALSAQAYELPQQAKDFLGKHYPDNEILTIQHKSDYDVVLNNFTKIEFTRKGELIEINSKMADKGIPDSLIPEKVRKLINDKWPEAKKVSLEYNVRDNSYELQLDNNVTIQFFHDGTLIDISF